MDSLGRSIAGCTLLRQLPPVPLSSSIFFTPCFESCSVFCIAFSRRALIATCTLHSPPFASSHSRRSRSCPPIRTRTRTSVLAPHRRSAPTQTLAHAARATWAACTTWWRCMCSMPAAASSRLAMTRWTRSRSPPPDASSDCSRSSARGTAHAAI